MRRDDSSGERSPALPRSGWLQRERLLGIAICGLLLLMVGLVFAQTIHHNFVSYDDRQYVCDNPAIKHGFTGEAIRWAFTSTYAANWHPLTWLSHILDVRLYGSNAGGHHLTNVLLHAANTVLLFLLLWRMTGDLWPSALVAAVFAVHPLRAESVAWVAERKDVLCGLFFMLTIGAYVSYARHRFSIWRYLAVVILFALGLMAKPMLVTLPFVLLLLDYWPLGRFSGERPRSAMVVATRLIAEKLPLLLLSAASCIITPLAQGRAVAQLDQVTVSSRIGNAVVSYVAYVRQFFWPVDLAALYLHPANGLPGWKVAGALVALAIVFVVVFLLWRRCPYLLVGWLWYVGMLVPVIGLMQVGMQSMADRYTYLPQIGLGIALAWGAADVVRRLPRCRVAVAFAAPTAVAALMVLCWCQTAYWHDSELLWRRVLDCDPKNPVALGSLANELVDQDRFAEALPLYQASLEINPRSAEYHSNFGTLLLRTGQAEEAYKHLQTAMNLDPQDPRALVNFGIWLGTTGKTDEALACFRKAVTIDPMYAPGYANIGTALAKSGHLKQAADNFRKVVELTPEAPRAYIDLAHAFTELGQFDEAIRQYRTASVLARQQGKESLERAINGQLGSLQSAMRSAEKNSQPAMAPAARNMPGDKTQAGPSGP